MWTGSGSESAVAERDDGNESSSNARSLSIDHVIIT